MKGNLTNHTENSLNQSTLSVKALVHKAVEMGMTSLALTNLDNVIAVGRFLDLAKDEKNNGINLIPGVELRVGHMDSHIILLAKNIEGYKSISKLITEANHPDRIKIVNVTAAKSFSYPIADLDLLEKYADGNIIALTGGKNGILASILLTNEELDKKLAVYKDTEQLYSIQNNSVQALTAKLNGKTKELTDIKTTLKANKKQFDKMNETFKAGGQLTDEEMKFAKEYTTYAQRTELLQMEISTAKEQIKTAQASLQELTKKMEERNVLIAQKASNEELYKKTWETACRLKQIYGTNLFMELQNHLSDNSEKGAMRILADMAIRLQIPMVASNDVYMLDGSKMSITARQVIMQNGTEQYVELTPAQQRQYLISEQELQIAMMDLLNNEQLVDAAMTNIDVISANCKVVIDNPEYHAPKFDCANAPEELRKMTMEGVAVKYAGRPDMPGIIEKINYELSVIENMGFSDYLLIVADFLRIGRRVGTMSYAHITYLQNNMKMMTLDTMLAYIAEHENEDPGEAIGPGRGSAAGSIVCYGTGITNIDPTKYGLMFERFLNPERVSMPDIDSDFSFESRDICIEYTRKKYGEDAVASINTESTASAKADIKLIAKAFAKRDSAGMTKSEADVIKKQYTKKATLINALVPKEVNAKLADCSDTIRETYGNDPMIMEILELAEYMEGCITNYGTHAAGIIIGDRAVSDYIAMMWDHNNNVYKVQCDMIEAEGMYKLLKMDFLGLRTLSIITKAMRLVKQNKGITIDIDSIPFEDEIFQNVYCKLRTTDVFQCESAFMKDVINKIHPNNISELIMAVAVGRPGPIDFLPEIVAVKNGEKKPNYLIPEMAEILDETYGSPVYQEQIMKLMQLAGMSAGEADNIRRYMSKKKTEKFEAYRPKFVNGMIAKGANEKATNDYWDSLINFSKYAFNKSHAAIYAIVSYQTAWLKYHYPAETICACMEYNENPDKLPGIIADAWDFGVELIGPDVNNMQPNFSCVKHENGLGIQFGLTSMKGCGDALAITVNVDDHFESLADFIFKKRYSKKVTASLIYAGAFNDFSQNRKLLTIWAEYLYKKLDTIKDKEKKIKLAKDTIQVIKANNPTDKNWKEIFEANNLPAKTKNMPKLDKTIEKLKTTEEEYEVLLREFYNFIPAMEQDNPLYNLEMEKEILGFYISGHPVNYYVKPEYALTISKLTADKNVETGIYGIISNLSVKSRKKDGKPMAFFTLEDNSGSVEVCCFTTAYEQYGHMLRDGAVIALKGKCTVDEHNSSDEETMLQFMMSEAEECRKGEVKNNTQPDSSSVSFHFASPAEYMQFAQDVQIDKYWSATGVRLFLFLGNNRQCLMAEKLVHPIINLTYQQWKAARTQTL